MNRFYLQICTRVLVGLGGALVVGDLARLVTEHFFWPVFAVVLVLPLVGPAFRIAVPRSKFFGPAVSGGRLGGAPVVIVIAILAIHGAARVCTPVRQLELVRDLRAEGIPVRYDHRALNFLDVVWDSEALSSIRSLTLRSDEEVRCYLGRSGAREVYLEGKDVTDRSIAEIGSIARLRHITVESTEITDAGLAELRRLLPQVTIDVRLPDLRSLLAVTDR